MRTIQTLTALFAILASATAAQTRRYDQDQKLNNLVHPPGYQSSAPDALGNVEKVGGGPQDMVLIAGAGFGADIWSGFIKNKKDRFTMYAVTLPGFGKTPAPPMPPDGTSYGEQSWTRGAQNGVQRFIREKNLKRPILVAHWIIASDVILGVTMDNPDLVHAAIVIAGRAKTMQVGPQRGPDLSTAQKRTDYVDRMLAPYWFKTVTRDTWDDNNFYPHDYARHPVRALQLWRQAASPSLPIWVRYLCESWTQDAAERLAGLKVPVLIVKPGFDEDFYADPNMDYMRAFCQKSWKGIEKVSDLITVRTVDDARVFIMDDQPEKLDAEIDEFLNSIP